jgi:hypothetical protein
MKTKHIISILLGVFATLFLVSFAASQEIEKNNRTLVIPPPAWKGQKGWDSDLTLFQIENLSQIKATDGIDESWVSWLQTSLIGLVLEPKTYDNDPQVMTAYGLLGLGNHYSDLMNDRQGQHGKLIKELVSNGVSEEVARNTAPTYWKILIGDKFDTKQKKDTFLAWCMKQSEYILWTLSKEEARIYTKEMYSAYDSVARPDWLEKEKMYYAELQRKDKVSDFTKASYDGKTEGRKLTCFVYRRCLDGSTTPEEAMSYMKLAIRNFELEAASH